MRIFLLVATVLSGLFGVFSFFVAKSAIHEILGMISFLIVAVIVSAVYIVDSIERLKAKL